MDYHHQANAAAALSAVNAVLSPIKDTEFEVATADAVDIGGSFTNHSFFSGNVVDGGGNKDKVEVEETLCPESAFAAYTEPEPPQQQQLSAFALHSPSFSLLGRGRANSNNNASSLDCNSKAKRSLSLDTPLTLHRVASIPSSQASAEADSISDWGFDATG